MKIMPIEQQAIDIERELIKATLGTLQGGLAFVTDHLDRPTSLPFIGKTAYFVSLAGEVWKIEDVSRRRDHDSR